MDTSQVHYHWATTGTSTLLIVSIHEKTFLKNDNESGQKEMVDGDVSEEGTVHLRGTQPFANSIFLLL